MEVREKIYGPIDVSFEHSRCTLDMKTCEKFMTFNIRELCKKLSDTTLFYSDFIAAVTPRLVCPIAVGNYTAKSTNVNLQFISYLPIDGYIYNTIVKGVSMDPVKKTRKLIWCGKFETKVLKVRVKS